ncbi:WD40 domain-containing protein [Cephalotus follicularis]|uniref:WD40 domain-containing protein n=1 Tax=Cephalotus follicularis TaxID=3775 RepID=A0A1Q3DBN5_CEPFO|nr:WD40 domain-containing protein [Cephalotus follicularis]
MSDTVSNYDVWISEPTASVSERRTRLLRELGLSRDPSLSRVKPELHRGGEGSFLISSRDNNGVGDFNRSVSSDRLSNGQTHGGDVFSIVRSKSDGCCSVTSNNNNYNNGSSSNGSHEYYDDNNSYNNSSILSIHCTCSCSSCPGSSCVNNISSIHFNEKKSNAVAVSIVKSLSGKSNNGSPPVKPPLGKNCRRLDYENRNESVSLNVNVNSNGVSETGFSEDLDCNGISKVVVEDEKVCTIKNLDNGKEFVVNEIREDGMWNKLKEVGTGKQLTMEEFEMSVGHSPIVQELMRRQNVEEGNKDNLDLNANGVGVGGSKLKKRGGWLKSIKSVATSVAGHKERRSSDERDTSSEKGGRRSSSATDDSQDVSFHGPERVRVRQYGKSSKELTALYKSQEIQAHNGSIWSIKFSLDGRYLASAGEDCVIHVWKVVESERKGELLMDKQEDGNLNFLFLGNGSPEPSSVSPLADSYPEKKRRSRSSINRKSVSLDHTVVPETVFALSEKPICSFRGHLHDVLDLSWSKSQQLLSSSMDKTVRLWDLSSKSCLKIFSHSDYVTCIQFNPVDDKYFISGSLDAKVRIWSIPDRQVVDWNDLHEMVTSACYTPDGQGALVGSYKGSCRLYSTFDNKLQRKCQINLQNKKKKAHQKKITGFQFAPGSSSEVLITSADSRVRVIDGVDLIHKFKGFRNTNSQISASLTANGKYIVSASEDSYVYIWKHETDSRPSRNKGVTVTRSYEHFHCQDVSVAIPWPGMGGTWGLQDTYSADQNVLDQNLDEVFSANHPPTPVEAVSEFQLPGQRKNSL